MRLFLRLSLLICLSLFLTACNNNTTVRHNASYPSILESKRQVALLHPDVEVYSVDISGRKTRLYDYEHNMEFIIIEELNNAFRAKDFHTTLVTRRDAHEHHIEEDVARFKARYLDIKNTLYKQHLLDPKKAHSIDENAGEIAEKISNKIDSRFIVATNYNRDITTSGARAVKLISAAILGSSVSSSSDLACLTIGIIDGETGSFVWSNQSCAIRSEFSSSSKKAKEKAELKVLLNETLKSLLKQK